MLRHSSPRRIPAACRGAGVWEARPASDRDAFILPLSARCTWTKFGTALRKRQYSIVCRLGTGHYPDNCGRVQRNTCQYRAGPRRVRRLCGNRYRRSHTRGRTGTSSWRRRWTPIASRRKPHGTVRGCLREALPRTRPPGTRCHCSPRHNTAHPGCDRRCRSRRCTFDRRGRW